MGLFSRKPKIVVCDICGRADVEGCGSAEKHVVEIRGDEPAWLPPNYRAQAQGEFTWLCLLCGSYPAVKWPSQGAAWAGLAIHLGNTHFKGEFQGIGGPRIEMINVR